MCRVVGGGGGGREVERINYHCHQSPLLTKKFGRGVGEGDKVAYTGGLYSCIPELH